MGIVEVYFCHMVDQVDVPISFLEYTPTNEESIGAFNKEGDKGDNEGDRLLKVQCFAVPKPDTIAPTQALTNASTELVVVELTQPAASPNAERVETELVVAVDDNPVVDFD
ncbi:hypothetical protein KY290_010607 [Solanum tuberosum]|uniref:Integrase core domain containing protein n=1 Tax=Solanum tuberosum TaxID=4113 RepID=A0ABQ7VYA3_SOLTU|nr:hypothetical protein KY290_010607 [Solanum tuberosum]